MNANCLRWVMLFALGVAVYTQRDPGSYIQRAVLICACGFCVHAAGQAKENDEIRHKVQGMFR